jgi:hypothetical protein
LVGQDVPSEKAMRDTLKDCIDHPFGATATRLQARLDQRKLGQAVQELPPPPLDERDAAPARTEAEPSCEEADVERDREPENRRIERAPRATPPR